MNIFKGTYFVDLVGNVHALHWYLNFVGGPTIEITKNGVPQKLSFYSTLS